MKKYLSIFLIFFLLFGVSVPAFASSTTLVPPSLNSTQYDTFTIIDAYDFDPFTMDDPVPAYCCFVYDSSEWEFFHIPANDRIIFRFVSDSDSPSEFSYSFVHKSSYDSTSVNNGWGTFEPTWYNDYNVSGGTVYGRMFEFTYNGLDYYDSQTDSLTHNPVLLSNVNIYNGSWSSSTGADISNEVFFSPTPPLVVETQKALTQFQTQTSQTIMIIVLCGVGCLAFLISLPILRKVLLRFLNR